LEESRKPLMCTTSTCDAIAELHARIETMELAIQEIADAAGVAMQETALRPGSPPRLGGYLRAPAKVGAGHPHDDDDPHREEALHVRG